MSGARTKMRCIWPFDADLSRLHASSRGALKKVRPAATKLLGRCQTRPTVSLETSSVCIAGTGRDIESIKNRSIRSEPTFAVLQPKTSTGTLVCRGDGVSTIMLAAKEGLIDVLGDLWEMLQAKYASGNKESVESAVSILNEILRMHDVNGYTALHYAVRSGEY